MTAEQQELVSDLLTAFLAVNSWSVERVCALRPGLVKEQLSQPSVVRSLSLEEIQARLTRAGYARGDYMTALLSVRLFALAEALNSIGIETVLRWEHSGQREQLESWLRSVKGAGPGVLGNFLALRSAAPE